MPKLAAVRLFYALVLLFAVTSAIFAGSLPSPAAASPADWSEGTPIDPSQGYLSSISCPTANFCVTVDFHGNVFTYNGSSWSSPDNIDPGTSFMAVSCPSASFCAAVDFTGHALTYNGSSWSSPERIDGYTPWSPSRARRRAFAKRWTTTGPTFSPTTAPRGLCPTASTRGRAS